MINFPVAGGTSGHLLGGVLAGVLLGPAAGIMALATVLAVQCLFFQDGGLTALGANVLNLALVGAGGGYLVYRLGRLLVRGAKGLLLSTAVAAWASMVLASAACALELAAAGTVPLRLVFPAMTLTHMVVGLGEALITTAVVSFVLKVRPDLLYEPVAVVPPGPEFSWKMVAGCGLALALGIALLLPPAASPLPDGLEKLAEDLGFAAKARADNAAPLPDYTVPGMKSTWLATSLAAVAGTLLSFVVAGLAAWGLVRWWRRSQRGAQPHVKPNKP